MKTLKLLTFTLLILSFSSCLIQKKDPYANLTKYNLCNKTKTTKEATCPYVNDEKLRIATKRHFSGDSLMIEMRVLQQEPNEETSSSNIQATQLQPGECMDYYLELTDTEQLRMDNIEQNGYNLNISRYISTTEDEILINLDDVNKRLTSINKHIEKKTAEHNKFLKELGLKTI